MVALQVVIPLPLVLVCVCVWKGRTRNKNTDPLYEFLENSNHVTARSMKMPKNQFKSIILIFMSHSKLSNCLCTRKLPYFPTGLGKASGTAQCINFSISTDSTPKHISSSEILTLFFCANIHQNPKTKSEKHDFSGIISSTAKFILLVFM